MYEFIHGTYEFIHCNEMPIVLPLPDPKAEARAHTGLIALDSAYVLPLLLAGAAFAKVRGLTIQI